MEGKKTKPYIDPFDKEAARCARDFAPSSSGMGKRDRLRHFDNLKRRYAEEHKGDEPWKRK